MISVTELRVGERVLLEANHRSEPVQAQFEGIFPNERVAMRGGAFLLKTSELPGAGSVARFLIWSRIHIDMRAIFRVQPDGTMCDDAGHSISVVDRMVIGHG